MKRAAYVLLNFLILSFIYWYISDDQFFDLNTVFIILFVINTIIFWFYDMSRDKVTNTQKQTQQEEIFKTEELQKYYENKIERLSNELSQANYNIGELKQEINKISLNKKDFEVCKSQAMHDIKKLMNEAEIDFPYYASIITNYECTLNEKYINYLKNKPNPAIKTAEKMKEINRELKKTLKEKKILEFQQSVYEDAFPWLYEYKIANKDDIKQISEKNNNESEEKRLLHYLSAIEYEKLSTTEKYQLALDRYKKSHKTNWEIGISFERYIGYLYEQQGYKVIFYGAIMGLEDLGRDIIAYNTKEVIIIQCKYWSENKIVHEKHIFQLYGSMLALSFEEHPEYNHKIIKGHFITSATLSDKAKFYADKLDITYVEKENFNKEYPCIKCNISNKDNEKIYHLPFDQQYDKVQIDISKGECYATTILEAESLGFRRAKKWIGENNNGTYKTL